MNLSVTYTPSVSQTSFAVPFAYLRADRDLIVTVDGTEVDFSEEYAGQVLLDTAATSGQTVIIRRSTETDPVIVDFTDPGAVTAQNLDDAVAQARHAAEEANYRLDNLTTGTDGAELPEPSVNQQVLFSLDTGSGIVPSWKTLAQAQTALGVSAIVPAPVSGSRFLTTNPSTATYELHTLAEVRTLLGMNNAYLVPEPSGSLKIMFTNSAGTGYQLLPVSDLVAMLALGSAASKNTGTAVNQIPVLVSGSGAVPALPAVSGEFLTRVAPAAAYCRITSGTSASALALTDGCKPLNGSTAAVTVSHGTHGVSVDSSTGTITLPIGKFHIAVEQHLSILNGTAADNWLEARVSLNKVSGTFTAPNNTTSGPRMVNLRTNGGSGYRSDCLLTTFGVAVEAISEAELVVNVNDTVPADTYARRAAADLFGSVPSTRINIWKIA